MFRDKEQELERLNRQLLEEEEEDEDEEYDEEDDEEYDEENEAQEDLQDYNAYNSDTADVDLDAYSDEVYTAPRRGCGCAALAILLTSLVLLFLAYLLAKHGGIL